jgi:membrane protein DedA with SNARE-associated domain
MIGQVVGLLFLGIWLGERVNGLTSLLGAVIGGMVGLASGTISLYYMALSFENKVLARLGKHKCPRCKQAFEIGVPECPTCDLKIDPMTPQPSQD